ncbi:unnamed protein product (macronuclear) [Paramecium tetraurelia]|uniref:PAS domain-containing protein n=1 Tax=Paramecium tetraurelia TaxID=5888 RepID=A0BCP7_PARTE|nr:uncharacterized protein GSPATT00004408001 [Paramecium tetraurelia]CAK56314.1 unnamed protein product [Paramecium tetraurelia]|eukprot:XP_001423712.1 hypothetical protein (macronuclear) [Paramecium tetraurelia strain d4-2]
MNFTYQNFVHVLSIQTKTKIGVIKMLMILEFVQNVALCFPQHGWQQLKYDDKMLSSIQQITNYSLFIDRNHTEYLLEVFIISLSLIYFIMLFIYFHSPKQQKISQLTSITLNIFQKLFRIPLIVTYINFMNHNSSGFMEIIITLLIFALFLIFLTATTYFQRDIAINFSKRQFPLNQFYTPYLYAIYILDIIRIFIFVVINTQTGFVIFYLLTIITQILTQYHNLFQQNDPHNFNQGLIACNLIISVFLLLGLGIAQLLVLIFNILLYMTTLSFYLSTQINLFRFIKSNNILHVIENKIKLNFNPLFLKQDTQYKSDNGSYLNFIKQIVENEIKSNHYFQNENNVLILFDYLTKSEQSYFQALFILNKFEYQQNKLSFFYKSYNEFYKSSIQQEITQVNKSTLMIQQLNRDLLIEMEYSKRFTNILTKQIDLLSNLIQGSKNFAEVGSRIVKVSQSIQNTQRWLKKNNVLENRTNVIYLKISINFNSVIMQNYGQAIKQKKIIKKILESDHKTLEAIQIIKNKAIMLSVSMIRHRGQILNSNKSMLQFFGYNNDFKLEFMEQLMPDSISSLHNQFVERYLQRNQLKSYTLQNSLEVLQQQENGKIQCLELSFTVSNDKSDFIFISLLKKGNQDKGYIIFDQSGKITGMSNYLEQFNELNSQMKQYSYIQYFWTELFYIINNNEFLIEKEVSFVVRQNIQKIDNQYKNQIQSVFKLNNYSNIPNLDYFICSDRSEKHQLLSSKNCYSNHETYQFDFLEPQLQEKLSQLINLHITENDVTLKFKVKLSKIELKGQLIQYQLELNPLETKAEYEQVDNINDEILQIENVKAKSLNDVSIVSSEQKGQYILHDILLKQSSSQPFFQIYFYKLVLVILVVVFLIIQINQLEFDFDAKLTFTKYIWSPQLMNQFYNRAFHYGFNQVIYQNLNQSEYLKNSFSKEKEAILQQFRSNFGKLYSDLINIEQDQHSPSFNLTLLKNQISFESYSSFSTAIRENTMGLVSYQKETIQFSKSLLFFRLNIIQAYQNTIYLIEKFTLILSDYTSNFMVFWQTVLIIQIILFSAPFIINIRNWYYFEKRHKYLIQIISRINEDQASRLIEIKQQQIQQSDNEKQQMNMSQSYYTCKSPLRLIHSTINQSSQNLRSRDTQLLYERIQNKSISIVLKLAISLFCYIALVALASFGYYQIKASDTQYMPIEHLIKTYVKFQAQLGFLLSFASILKGQHIFEEQFSKISDPEIGDFRIFFQDDQVPKYFQNISQTYQKKIISIFSSIILSDQIDEGDKSQLYDLYKGDFCDYLMDELPFCNKSLTSNEFQLNYGSFYPYENNSDVLRKGIIGFISNLDSLFKNDFEVEITYGIYQKNITDEIQYYKEFNNLVVQYFFNVSDAFALFYEKVDIVSQNFIKEQRNNLLIYFYSFGLTFLLVYFIIILLQIIYSQRRYKNYILALVTLSEDVLNDKTNLSLLKRLSQ